MLADGRAVPIERQTCSMTATIMTPWAPATIRLALALMRGKYDLLIVGSKTLRKKLSVHVMKQLRDTAAGLGGGASRLEHAPAEELTMPPKEFGVRCVAVTMEEMQQVAHIEVEAAGETDGFNDALLDMVSKRMMGFGDNEIPQREPVLEDAILRVARAGMAPDDLAELWYLVLGPYKEAFRRGLTGKPPAQVELGSVQLRSMAAYACPDADDSLPSKSAIKDKKLKLVELVGGYMSERTTFDPDSVEVMIRDLMDAQERRHEEVLELVRKNQARRRGGETKGVLPDFAIGDYILVARVGQPGTTPKPINT